MQADHLKGAAYVVPSRLVRRSMRRQPNDFSNWVNRIAVDLDDFISVFRDARVRVELVRLEKGGWPSNIGIRELFGPYVQRSMPRRRAVITSIHDTSAVPQLEKQLQISLAKVMAAYRASDPRQHKLLVRVWFPANDAFHRMVVSKSEPILDRFELARSTLTERHRRRLRVIARHIDATWQRKPWQLYRPVTHVVIEGHTDRVGSEAFNQVLGQARAPAASRDLHRGRRGTQ